jgi:hypothetical protein
MKVLAVARAAAVALTLAGISGRVEAQLLAAPPPIRNVPRPADSTFTNRVTICPDAKGREPGVQANEARLSVVEILGTIAAVDVHQFGTGFSGFPAVQRYLADLLTRRPRTSYTTLPWAEGTPLAALGVLGTVHFASGVDAHLEAAGTHLCLQDRNGLATWWRLGPTDLW